MPKPIGLICIATVGLFAACSSVVPPQTFSNPIGISGRTVQVKIGAAAISKTSAGLGGLQTSFADIDISQIPIALNTSQSLFRVGFTSNVRLQTDVAPLPCAIVLTQLNVQVTLSDSLHRYTLPTFALNKEVRLEQEAQDPTAYKIATPGVFVGNVLNQSDAQKVQEIITGGGTNQVDLKITVLAASVPDLPPNSTLTLTFDLSEATLKF